AIKRLRQGIQNLNREARERLLASFEMVSNHFKHLFTELFGGGTAELQLIEHEDPLEAGLEIIASRRARSPRRCPYSPAASRRSRHSRSSSRCFSPTRRRSACWTRSTPRSMITISSASATCSTR